MMWAGFISLLVGLFVSASTRAAAPSDGTSDYLNGLDALSSAKWKHAESAFAKAIDADEENADYYIARGVAQALAEDPQRAEKDFQRALKLHPNYEEARLWLASAIDMQGDFMRSGGVYPPAQRDHPNENAVRDTAHAYGQGVWMNKQTDREG